MGSFEKEAEAVAKLGLRVLNGERTQDIPVTQAPKFSYIFDWHQLKRWSIPENKLPPESMVMFEDLTTWDQYKGRIVGVIAMVLLQALIIFYLLFQRRIRL